MNYLQNLKDLRAFIATTPEERIDLTAYVLAETHGCGTLHCTMGWIPYVPTFKNMGIVPAKYSGVPMLPVETVEQLRAKPEHVNLTMAELTTAYLFGDAERWQALFNSYGDGTWDDDLIGDDVLTHKELALARLDYAINQLEKQV